MKKTLAFALTLALSVVVLPATADAHGGRTNSSGCHNDNKNGGYHCHNGGSANSSGGSGSSSSSGKTYTPAPVAPVVVPHYRVSQGNTYLNIFANLNDAVAYAKQWESANIIDTNNNQWVWDNIYSTVYQGKTFLKDFASLKAAKAYAPQFANAKILDKTGKVQWHNYARNVYQGTTYLKSFKNEPDAVAYAKLWAHSKVIDTLTNQVVYKDPNWIE